jgi:hypothetical protein
VSYPPNPPEGSDNPYGGPPPPGQEPNPYGAAPYGAGPYGGQPPYQGGGERPKFDAVSIAALVLGLSCCLSLVGAILGFVGLSRTKYGKRRGRWAAVVGIIAGFVGTVAFAAAIIFVVWFASNTVTPGNAEVGQCVNIDDDDDGVTMLKKECSEDHDAEIVGVEELDADSAKTAEEQQISYCSEVLSEDDVTTIFGRDDIELNAVFEDPNNVEDGDHIVCFVEATKGKLDEKVLD